MQDTIIKGTGNSRAIRMPPNTLTIYPTWEAFVAGAASQFGAPVDILGLNPAGCDQIGTDLNKETLLQDDTAEIIGMDPENSTVDMALKMIATGGSGISWSVEKVQWNFYSVAYGNGRFVAMPTNGTIAAYSDDGITWTQTSLPASGQYQCVAYGNGRFVALLRSSAIAVYSNDGITWTQTSLPMSGSWQAVTYGNGRFVAVEDNGGVSPYSKTAIYSDNGITWSKANMPVQSLWRSITFGNGMFVATSSSTNPSIAYSQDGVTWTRVVPPSGYVYIGCIAYGNDLFVVNCGGSGNYGDILYSHDGENWTLGTAPVPEGKSIYSIAYGDGWFVGTVSGTDVTLVSRDGITWKVSSIGKNSSWNDAVFGDGKFIVVSNGGTVAIGVPLFKGGKYTELQQLGQQMTELELLLLTHINQTEKEETV